jgi:hypothetical protein
MIRDAFPHVASLMVAIGGSGVPLDVVCNRNSDAGVLDLEFTVTNAGGGPLRIRARFTHCPRQPRPAAYAIDGQWLRRRLGPGYVISMQAGAREWTIEDPLAQSVSAFLGSVRATLEGRPAARAGASALAACATDELRIRVARPRTSRPHPAQHLP